MDWLKLLFFSLSNKWIFQSFLNNLLQILRTVFTTIQTMLYKPSTAEVMIVYRIWIWIVWFNDWFWTLLAFILVWVSIFGNQWHFRYINVLDCEYAANHCKLCIIRMHRETYRMGYCKQWTQANGHLRSRKRKLVFFCV